MEVSNNKNVESAIIHYIDGTTTTIYDFTAQSVYEAFQNNRVLPNGILQFDDSVIFLAHAKKIDWHFKS